MSVGGTAVYHDLQSLSALRARAGRNPGEAVEEVAVQFESIFTQMMLKSMRDATIEGGLFESSQMEHYQSMFDQQISLDLSSQGALGLADILVDQLGSQEVGAEQTGSRLEAAPPPSSDPRKFPQLVNLYSSMSVGSAGINHAGDVGANADSYNKPPNWSPSSPEEFMRDIWAYAVDAAKQLGVDPSVLVAQSALETGWGKRVIPTGEGQSSFNLFGVKAGSNWHGESTAVQTLEFRDSLPVKEKASFRVYTSIENSFSDYVDFLKGNPRYQQALDRVGDSREFLMELQDAGYATDPQYADKIMGIVSRGSYSAIVEELKNSQKLPLSS